MFFDDPAAAFANIRRAVRPGGQLAFLAWRGREHNPFQTAGERGASASAVLPDSAPASTDGVGQFGFARAGRVRRILRDSG